MSQDLRDLFKQDNSESLDRMKAGHGNRFFEKLEKELPKTKTSPSFLWKVAASVVVLLGVTLFFVHREDADSSVIEVANTDNRTEEIKRFSLGDLSPNLRKVEDYYVSTINFELSKLELTEDNKDLIDGYLDRISELDEEYKNLNIELNEIGPNDQTINALIKNLQLRLQLLQKLKVKLSELKSSENEQGNII